MADQMSKQKTNLAEKSIDRSLSTETSRETSGRRRCQSEASLDKDESSKSNKPADGRKRKRTRSMTTKDTDGTMPSLSNKKHKQHKLSRNKAFCKTGPNKEEGECSEQPSSHEDQNAMSVSTTKIIPVFGKKKGASVEPSTENSTTGSDKTSDQRKEEMNEEANSKGEENLAIHSDIELLPQSCEGENVGDIKNIGFAGMKQAVSDRKGLDREENKDEGDQKVKESLGDGKPSEEDAVKHTPKQLQSSLSKGDQNTVDEINLEGQTSMVTNEEVKVSSNMNPDDICVSKTSPPRLMIEKDSSPIEVCKGVHAKSSPLKNVSPPDEPMIDSITPQDVGRAESTTSDDAHEFQVTKTTLAACNVDGRTTPEISQIAEYDALDSRGCKVDLEGAGVGKKSTAAKICTLADGVETVHGRNKELSCAETGSDQTSKVTAEIMLDTFSSTEDMNIQRNDSAPVCIPRDSATYTQENEEVILHGSAKQLEDMSKEIKVEAAQVCGTVHSSNALFKEASNHDEDPRQGRSSPEQEQAMGFSDETKDDTIKTLDSTGHGSKTQPPGLNCTSENMLAWASPDDKDNQDQDGISTLKTVLTFEAEQVNRPGRSGIVIQKGGVDVGDDLPQFCLQDSEGQLCSSDGDGLVIDMMDFTDSQIVELDLQCNMSTKPQAVSSSPLSSRDHSDFKSAMQCEDKAVQTPSPQVVCQDGNGIVQRMIQDIQSLNSTIVEIKRQIEGVRRQSRQDGGQRQLPQKRPWSAGKGAWKRPFLKK